MIPKNKDPFMDSPLIDEKKLNEWRKAFDENRQLIMNKLLVCPCGKTPSKLYISEAETCKWAYVSGDCCGEWNIEFRTGYYKTDSNECMELAIKQWNDSPRANR